MDFLAPDAYTQSYKDSLDKLREETNVPMVECKKALILSSGNFEEAKSFLQSGKWLSAKLVTARSK